jgi:hypothetical protein
MLGRLGRLVVFAAIAALHSGCLLFSGRHWDETRVGVIEPVNSALHRHLPRDIKQRDLDAVVALYATENGTGLSWSETVTPEPLGSAQRMRWTGPPASEPIRVRYAALLAQFDTIERAEGRVRRVHWDQRTPEGYPADVRLLIRGTGPDGTLRIVDQYSRMTIDQRGSAWVITSDEVIAREVITTGQPAFEVATSAAGLDDVHDTAGSPVFRLLGDLAASSGTAVADFDCDGFEDIALFSTDRLALYRNRADGSFEDVSADRGIPAKIPLAGTGLVFFDADNDGDPDLWLSGIYGERFLRNDDCRVFVDVTTAARIGPSRWSSMPLVADYDRDGLLDVFVIRMGDHEKTAPTPNWDARNGVASTLYHNNGDGTFTDVSEKVGIEESSWGLAAAWGDYNDDGWPDLYVGNEFGTNSLWRNSGKGTFVEVAADVGALDRGAAMGVAWGDADNDADLDLFVSNMYANSSWALFHPEYPAPVPWYFSWVPRADVNVIIDELTRGSTLLRNNGDGTFTDVSDTAGVRDGQWGWAAEFVDFDNDGWQDIFATNGFVTGNLPDDL